MGNAAAWGTDRVVLRNARCRIPGRRGRRGHLSGPDRWRGSGASAEDSTLAGVVRRVGVVGRVGVGGQRPMRGGVVVPMCSVVGVHAILDVLAVRIARGAGLFLDMGRRMVRTCLHPEGIGGSEAQEEEPAQEGEYGMPKGLQIHDGSRIDAKDGICQRSLDPWIVTDWCSGSSPRSGAPNPPDEAAGFRRRERKSAGRFAAATVPS